jgi:Fe-S cluster assembly scaffold protein SufB
VELTAGAPANAPAIADAGPPNSPAARARPARRAPTDLSFRLDEALLERFASREPDWLTADRRQAFAAFGSLPTESSRLYTPYVDLRAAELEGVSPYDEPATAVPDRSSAAAIPEGAGGLASFREDQVEALELDADARAAGLTIDTLGGLLRREPEVARRLLGGGSLPADDRLAQLTRAGWNQGVVVRVPAGARLARPVVIRWAAGAPGRALLTRTIVDLADGAAASLLEELIPSGPEIDCAAGETVPQALFAGTLEVRLGRGAELSVASIQDFGPRQIVFQHRNASIGESASLRWALAQLGSRLARSRVDNRLQGDRSKVEQVEIVFGGDEQLFDLTSYTRHTGRDTTGNLLSKGVLLDRSRTYMKGLIEIERSAVGTDSFLGEFGMNLSRNARAVAIPSLEIDQPDCRRAAHSSSVGPIDETQLFYLESRGIPADEARKFIVLGFLEPVVARVPLLGAQDRLRDLLEAKWAAGWPVVPAGTGVAA